MTSLLALVAALAVVVGLGGCASYRPAPLPEQPDLAAELADLDLSIPAAGRDPSSAVDIARPLTIDDIGLLAILNNPGLKSERGTLDVARAGLLQAALIPDPTATLSYGQLIAGPGTASSIAASLAQDIAALINRPARVNAAAAHLGAVNAEELWREWQIAQKARQLAVDLHWGGEAISLVEAELKLIGAEVAQVRKAIAKGNLTLTALAPLLTAQATAAQSLSGLRLSQLKNWQALDALMGLLPRVRFVIARPSLAAPPIDPAPLLAELPEYRPDLAALHLGYLSAEEDVRAAILGQFPAFSIGPSYGSDTTKVVTIGPSFTFALPIFDRNQGKIAASRATRLLLREQYQARLDAAVANVQALYAQLRRLNADLGSARKAAAAARSLAATARQAYAQGNLDERSLTDYETTALERAVQVTTIERQIGEDQIMLAVELGLDLPHVRIALSGAAP
ncbi:MAG TPA: TolC family protein [Stellaceae bacterium]|nr:TolC family protein [Stellaceae bacterium]